MHKNLILHLTLIENIGPAVIQKIKERFLLRQGFEGQAGISVSDLYSSSPTDWMHTFGFSQSTSEKLVDGLANTRILETELALIEQNNIQWVTFEDELYPQLLKNIYLPPAVLYYQGSFSSGHPDPSIHPTGTQGERSKLLAVVGARKADEYGYRIVNQLIPELVAANYTIVSGGALGIDAAAHAATIKSGGTTIAVLGSGLLLPYPSSNKKLFESIVANGGCLMSSFPLMMDALPGHFPARNRIVTGLSHGCLVVQAAQKSGALISAHYALEQGREVFAIPGPIDSELSAGCNTLIQQGAKLVTCTADILEEFGDRVILPDKKVIQEKAVQMSLEAAVVAPVRYVSTSSTRTVNISSVRPAVCSEAFGEGRKPVEGYPRALKDKYSNYSQQQKLIITVCKKSISFDDIIITTQLSHDVLQTELFNLQLDGVISQDFTGMWVAH